MQHGSISDAIAGTSAQASSPASSFGTLLRELRLAGGFAQDDVARAIGVRTLSYGRWERDQQNPGAANRLALAEFHGIDPVDLGYRGPETAVDVAAQRPSGATLDDVVAELRAMHHLLERIARRLDAD